MENTITPSITPTPAEEEAKIEREENILSLNKNILTKLLDKNNEPDLNIIKNRIQSMREAGENKKISKNKIKNK